MSVSWAGMSRGRRHECTGSPPRWFQWTQCGPLLREGGFFRGSVLDMVLPREPSTTTSLGPMWDRPSRGPEGRRVGIRTPPFRREVGQPRRPVERTLRTRTV